MVIAVLTGCAAPSVYHVGTSGLYFDVPRTWTSVDENLLKKAETGWNADDAGAAIVQSLTWQTAWSTNPQLVPADVFSNGPSEFPIVYASARTLFDAEKSGIGTDILTALQDVVLPVSTAQSGDGLTIDVNQPVTLNQHQGIEQKLRWTTDGVEQQVRAVVMLSKDLSTVYTFTVRCTTECFTQNSQDVGNILRSITIKDPNAS
ncbi:MAG: hypothetical protein RIS43_951 [Actinomycetota bacterium]